MVIILTIYIVVFDIIIKQTLRNLEDAIENVIGCVIIVSHDRWFLDRLATQIIAFNNTENKVIWFEGNYREYGKQCNILENTSKKKYRNIYFFFFCKKSSMMT